MALAETAELIARLQLQDNMSAGLHSATSGLSQAESQVGRTHGALGRLQNVAGGVGGAFKHAAGQIGALGGLLGVAGLAGGGFALEHVLSSSISDVQEFGATVRQLVGISGESAQAMSGLSAGLEHFGIESTTQIKLVGMLEKNLGNLAAGGGKGATKVMADFGFSVLDASGHVKNAQQIISDFTNYYNNSATPASEKAALAAKLFGRSWQDLIPVLSAGSGALDQASTDAAKMGRTLTGQDLTALAANRDAMRKWGDAVEGLKTQIGLALIPTITDLANAATKFVTDHRQDIVTFLKQGIQFARQFAGFLTGTVIPTIKGLADTALAFWNKLPAGWRDMLVKGFVADRTIHFIFGVSPLDLGKQLGEEAAKGVAGGIGRAISQQFMGRGSTPLNPLFVVAENGGLGGVGGGVTSAGAGLRGVATVAAVTIVGGLAIDQLVQAADQNNALMGQKLTQDEVNALRLAQTMQAQGNLLRAYITPANRDAATRETNLRDALQKLGLSSSSSATDLQKVADSMGTTVDVLRGILNKEPGLTPVTVTNPVTMNLSPSLQQWLITANGREDRTPAPGSTTPFMTGMAGAPSLINTVTAPLQTTAANTGKTNDQLSTLTDGTTANTDAVTTSGNKTASAVNSLKPAISQLAQHLIAKFDLNHNGLVSMREALAQKLGISVEKLDKLRQGIGGLDVNLAARLGISNAKLQELIGQSEKIVGHTGDTKTFAAIAAQHMGTTSGHLRTLISESGGWNAKLAQKLGISYDKLKEIKSEAEKEKAAIDAARVAIQKKDLSVTVHTTVNSTTNISSRDVTRSVTVTSRYGKYVA